MVYDYGGNKLQRGSDFGIFKMAAVTMETAKIPGGPINTLPEVFASDQVAARDMVVSVEDSHAFSGYVDLIGNPIKLSKTPITYRQAPPMCGAHTQEILTELFGSDFKIKGTGFRHYI